MSTTKDKLIEQINAGVDQLRERLLSDARSRAAAQAATPRTDAVRHGPAAGSFFAMAEHAETLERELDLEQARVIEREGQIDQLVVSFEHWKDRAEKAEAELNRLRETIAHCAFQQRAEKAEVSNTALRAALERVTDYYGLLPDSSQGAHGPAGQQREGGRTMSTPKELLESIYDDLEHGATTAAMAQLQAYVNEHTAADLARFTADGMLDAHMICDQRDKAIAERDAARRDLAAAREELVYWNWAVNHPNEFAEIINDHIKWGPDKQKNDATLRAAIDAARAKGGTT